MDAARIAELLAPYLGPADDPPLTASDLGHISTYIDILQRWNARINLTAIRTQEEIVTRHFGESLFAARSLFPVRSSASVVGPGNAGRDRREAAFKERDRRRDREKAALEGPRPGAEITGALAPAVADVGSGAGFPGIPVKLWARFIHLTLIESNYKKSTFLREVVRALTLTDIDIQTARAETLKEKFDVATLRAVERFESILPIAAGLVAPAGRLALLIGASQILQARSTLPAVDWSDPKPIPQSQSRVLLIGTQGFEP